MKPLVYAVAVLVVSAIASQAQALDCSGGACGIPGRRLFVPIARAPVGIFKAGRAIAEHRRDKRQAGELPRQRIARGIVAVRPVRRVARGLAWVFTR